LNSPSFDKWYVHFATQGPIGRIPKAPGTFGSIPGLICGVLLFQYFEEFQNSTIMTSAKIFIIVLVTLFSFFVIQRTEDYWQLHDRKEIVVDEFAGQLIPSLFFSHDLALILISFVTFRFFDILKPWPVGYIDRHWKGAMGTLMDDIAAGILAFICTGLLEYFVL
jgi:phosphatidylglycerophosphatase A